ncbi:hypothetical protein T07_4537 [Trichinella nelsoni]|uniref:Uncharacterized protein n=1 Tax=Trichinella nelsoni TaxID=6336 RepID=A0A0V0RVH5_9BILA|nr:hypothetical protein T07_4537 [Trichinella nelsoni]
MFWKAKKAHGHVYKPGDHIWLQVPVKTKLGAHWDWPYLVQKNGSVRKEGGCGVANELEKSRKATVNRGILEDRKRITVARERERGRKGSRAGGSQTEDMIARRNSAVDTGPLSPSDDCDNSPDGVTNEPVRKSGLLQL